MEIRDDKEYRHGYADESTTVSVATQLKVLREQRNLTQSQLALEAGMRQSMISRYENVSYSSWSINTLRKLAVAFDVWLDVRFRSFGELVAATDEFSQEALEVPRFDDDPFFKDAAGMVAMKKNSRPFEMVTAVDPRFRNAISVEKKDRMPEALAPKAGQPRFTIPQGIKGEGGILNATLGNFTGEIASIY